MGLADTSNAALSNTKDETGRLATETGQKTGQKDHLANDPSIEAKSVEIEAAEIEAAEIEAAKSGSAEMNT
ncbi:MAG: hypothetical protein WBA01_13450, partial [Phormidesmis sp.]